MVTFHIVNRKFGRFTAKTKIPRYALWPSITVGFVTGSRFQVNGS
jgi:hypothetical protein